MPLPTRLESALPVARAELTAAELGVEHTRVRAPFDGTVLNVIAKEGEVAAPSPENTLLVFGDLSAMKVRAEVEERDAAKIHVGQRVVVRADAYPDQDFEGRVSSIAQSLSQPSIVSRGPRRPNDVEVLEAKIDLDGAAAAADRHARRRVLQARRHGLDEVGRAHIAEFEAGASSSVRPLFLLQALSPLTPHARADACDVRHRAAGRLKVRPRVHATGSPRFASRRPG